MTCLFNHNRSRMWTERSPSVSAMRWHHAGLREPEKMIGQNPMDRFYLRLDQKDKMFREETSKKDREPFKISCFRTSDKTNQLTLLNTNAYYPDVSCKRNKLMISTRPGRKGRVEKIFALSGASSVYDWSCPGGGETFFNSTKSCNQNWTVFRPVDDALMESWHTPWTNFQIVSKQQNKREYSPIESNRALLLCNDFIWTWLALLG